MRKTASVSTCEQFRWHLTRDWGDGERLCWVMLNPSDADDKIDDPTIRRVIHFTRSWGYTGFTVVNLYPFRSPHPTLCEAWATNPKLAATVKDALQQNADHVAEHTRDAAMVVAAWGNNPWDSEWLESIVESILNGGCKEIYSLGTTMHGAPKHPSGRGKYRVPDDQQPVLWRSGP